MPNKNPPATVNEVLEEMYSLGWCPVTVRAEIKCAEFKLRNHKTAVFTAKEEREVLRFYDLKGRYKC